MELKEAFLDFFHFSLPLKEQIRNSEMPVVSVDFEGKVFKEDDVILDSIKGRPVFMFMEYCVPLTYHNLD